MGKTRAFLAAAVLVAAALPALAAPISNPSFESTANGTSWIASLPGWTSDPSTTAGAQRVGLFFILGNYTATDGSAFAAITNNGTGSQAIQSSTFTIRNQRIEFDYVYATKNDPSGTTHLDPFTVSLITTGGGTETVYDLTGDLTNGQIGTSPFNGGTTFDSGWQTFSIDTSALIGQTAQIEFRIGDTTEGGGVSGVLLDNVAQIPEPGTFLLFGAGMLGLTAWARRRRTPRPQA